MCLAVDLIPIAGGWGVGRHDLFFFFKSVSEDLEQETLKNPDVQVESDLTRVVFPIEALGSGL